MNPQQPPAVTIYEAERLAGPEGAVERSNDPISESDAINRLRLGGDVVVCGPQRRANRNKARELMVAAFGGFEGDEVHEGRMALFHFHPVNRIPENTHAFFESPPRHARKRKQKK